MTAALQDAFNQASALPEAQQEVLATILLEEIAAEKNGKTLLRILRMLWLGWRPKQLPKMNVAKPVILMSYYEITDYGWL